MTATTVVRDPWQSDAEARVIVIPACPYCRASPCSTPTRCDRADEKARRVECRCGFDLCGECMRRPGRHGRMTVPGSDRRPA